MKLYEAMFLLNPNECARDWEETQKIVHNVIEREGCKITLTQKFDDQKLAYEVAGHKRATYCLVHFEGEGDALERINHTAGLTEVILRAMVVVDEDGAVEISPGILQMSYGDAGRRDGPGGRGGGRDGFRGGYRGPRREESYGDRGERRPPRAESADAGVEKAEVAPADAGVDKESST